MNFFIAYKHFFAQNNIDDLLKSCVYYLNKANYT